MPREPAVSRFLPVEQAVVLALAGDDSDGDLGDLLRGPIDWPVLIALAHSERATAELYRRLQTLTGVHVPDDARTAVQRVAMIADFEAAQVQDCLRDALAVLELLDARVMLLKG